MMQALKVARHEFRVTAANKAFVAITLLGPFLLLAISVLPALLATSGAAASGSVLALSGGRDLAPALGAVLEAKGARLEALPDTASPESIRAGVLAGTWSAALILPPAWTEAAEVQVFTRTGTDALLYASIERILGEAARKAKVASRGLDPALMDEVLRTPGLAVIKLGQGQAERRAEGDFLGVLLTVLSFVMLLYMTVLLYGQLIGRSVLQEKTAKTVEIMLSSLSARDLMIGKILGPGLAGLLQYGVWMGFGLLGILVLGPALHLSLPPMLSPTTFLWLFVFFIPAYFLYAALYAALGAGAEDEQHLTQLAWPVMVFLMIPVFLINLLVMSPDSGLSIALSLFPLTSPIVMLIRVLISPPPAWQLILSLGLLLASVLGTALLAGRVFRVGILLTGKRRKFGEILAWARR